MQSQIERLHPITDRVFRCGSAILRPQVFLPFLVLAYLLNSFWLLNLTVHDEKRLDNLTKKDSQHYIQIAHLFAQGDFSMSYVKGRPHRQPLYPLLLAPAVKLGGGTPFWMGSVNIWIGLLTIALIYFGILKVYSSTIIAAVIGLLYTTNRMIIEEVSGRIMTEPLHVLFVIMAIFCFIDYATSSRRLSLFAAAACVGMDYLTRPNGMILMIAMMAALFLHEVLSGQLGTGQPGERLPKFIKFVEKYSIAVGIFLLISTPSWIPRLFYLHHPFSHGYLSNYMWVDTYEQAHTGASYASFTWHDYVATHNFGDFLKRWLHGFVETFSLPARRESRFPVLFYLAIVGFIAACFQRNRIYLALAAFFLIQMLPLIWTTLSNPTDRVPYAAMLPFEFFFAAFALEALRRRVQEGTTGEIRDQHG